jgi:hypothetical protein
VEQVEHPVGLVEQPVELVEQPVELVRAQQRQSQQRQSRWPSTLKLLTTWSSAFKLVATDKYKARSARLAHCRRDSCQSGNRGPNR